MMSQTESSLASNFLAELKGIPTREILLEYLQNAVVCVTFNKLNGDERVMSCTLDSKLLPEIKRNESLNETKKKNIENKNIIVWDVNAKDWRSFRYDRITKIEFSSADQSQVI